jgi:hypothetical protein
MDQKGLLVIVLLTNEKASMFPETKRPVFDPRRSLVGPTKLWYYFYRIYGKTVIGVV